MKSCFASRMEMIRKEILNSCNSIIIEGYLLSHLISHAATSIKN